MLHNVHFWFGYNTEASPTAFTYAGIHSCCDHKNIGRVHLSTPFHPMPKHKLLKHIILSSGCLSERTQSFQCDCNTERNGDKSQAKLFLKMFSLQVEIDIVVEENLFQQEEAQSECPIIIFLRRMWEDFRFEISHVWFYDVSFHHQIHPTNHTNMKRFSVSTASHISKAVLHILSMTRQNVCVPIP